MIKIILAFFATFLMPVSCATAPTTTPTTTVASATTKPYIQHENFTQDVRQPTEQQYCQYPDRWTNPPGGCDNTDPAIPECLDQMYSREAEEQCIKQWEQR